MRKSRLGFTIIEVSLFLAISGLLFAGVAAGAGLNVARQRYNNAVEDYTEFLRRLYSQVENVQNEHDERAPRKTCTVRESDGADANATENVGRTECAMYGRIAIFDSKTDDKSTDNSNDKIMVYDVIGDVIDHDSSKRILNGVTDTLSALAAVHAEFLAVENTETEGAVVGYAGNTDFYVPDWSSHIETEAVGQYWSGAVLIVRSPIDGAIHTYILDLNNTNLRIYDPADDANADKITTVGQVKSSHAYLNEYFTSASAPKFEEVEANFCVNSDDSYAYNGRRRNVRIKAGGVDSSAVELIELDSEEENVCL